MNVLVPFVVLLFLVYEWLVIDRAKLSRRPPAIVLILLACILLGTLVALLMDRLGFDFKPRY